MKRFYKQGLVLACSALITACSSHWTAKPPASLSALNISSIQPDGYFTTGLKRQFRERGIQISSNAPMTLQIESIHYSNKTPNQINAGTAFATVPTLRMSYSLDTKQGKSILPRTWLSVTQSQLHNANQVNLSSINETYYKLLSGRLYSALYYQLSASKTQALIRKNKQRHHHAN